MGLFWEMIWYWIHYAIDGSQRMVFWSVVWSKISNGDDTWLVIQTWNGLVHILESLEHSCFFSFSLVTLWLWCEWTWACCKPSSSLLCVLWVSVPWPRWDPTSLLLCVSVHQRNIFPSFKIRPDVRRKRHRLAQVDAAGDVLPRCQQLVSVRVQREERSSA